MATNTLSDDPDDAVFKDPITGTTPTGPLESADPVEESDPGRWSTAAKWILIAVVALVLLGIGLARY
jgi:hypothetical protein